MCYLHICLITNIYKIFSIVYTFYGNIAQKTRFSSAWMADA